MLKVSLLTRTVLKAQMKLENKTAVAPSHAVVRFSSAETIR